MQDNGEGFDTHELNGGVGVGFASGQHAEAD